MTTINASSTRLSGIVLRQQNSFVRDLVFSIAIVVASIVSVASVTTAVSAASTSDQVAFVAR